MPLLIGVAGACSFPEVTFQEDGVGSPGSASSGAGSSAGGSGQGGAAQGSTSATGGGQGGQGGQGGGQGGQGGGQGGQGGCADTDKDNDMHVAVACGGTDCDDGDPSVFVGQAKFFEVARLNGSFDYNCNGVEEREFETVKCSGVACPVKTNVFLGDPMKLEACGATVAFGDCNGLCQVMNVTTKLMRCR
jgi:hypothetical protein